MSKAVIWAVAYLCYMFCMCGFFDSLKKEENVSHRSKLLSALGVVEQADEPASLT